MFQIKIYLPKISCIIIDHVNVCQFIVFLTCQDHCPGTIQRFKSSMKDCFWPNITKCWLNCFISVHRGGARAPPRTPPAPGPFGPLRGTRLALRRALYIEKLEKIGKIGCYHKPLKIKLLRGGPSCRPPQNIPFWVWFHTSKSLKLSF